MASLSQFSLPHPHEQFTSNPHSLAAAPPQLSELYVSYETSADVRANLYDSSILIPIFRLLAPPIIPIKTGQHVALLAAYSSATPTSATRFGMWESVDLHIAGLVRFISRPCDGWIRIAVGNDCPGSGLSAVAVMVPHVPLAVDSPSLFGPEGVPIPYIDDHENPLCDRVWFRPPVVGKSCGGARCAVQTSWMQWLQRFTSTLSLLPPTIADEQESSGDESDGDLGSWYEEEVGMDLEADAEESEVLSDDDRLLM